MHARTKEVLLHRARTRRVANDEVAGPHQHLARTLYRFDTHHLASNGIGKHFFRGSSGNHRFLQHAYDAPTRRSSGYAAGAGISRPDDKGDDGREVGSVGAVLDSNLAGPARDTSLAPASQPR